MKREHSYRHHDPSLKVQCEYIHKKHPGAHPPKPRFKHQAFIARNTLYLHGGSTLPSFGPFDSALDLHCFDLTGAKHKWEKVRLKCNSKDLQSVSGHCGAVRGDQWFMFGGTNTDFKCNNNLWRLNLNSNEVHKVEYTGEVPPPRESASMLIQDNWLLLYGGVNTNAAQIYNTFHLFNLDSSVWFKAPGNYLFQIQPRYDQAVCHQRGKVYLFGGTYRSKDNREMYLNDFYQITVSTPDASTSGQVTATRKVCDLMPQPRSGHSLVAVGQDFLLLVGGEDSQDLRQDNKSQGVTLVNSSWIYSITSSKWTQLILTDFKYRTQFSSCPNDNKVYTFGGLNNYSHILDDLVQFQLPIKEMRNISPAPVNCHLCSNKHSLDPHSKYVPASLIQDFADNIEFPFAAVGLLLDNAIVNNASLVNLHYFYIWVKDAKHHFFKIEDNATLPWSQEEFISSMVAFNMDSVQIPSGVDKRTKSGIVRDSLRRQYGDNAKLASLRLGSGFLHTSLSENEQQIRVFLFRKDSSTGKQRYTMKYYIVDRKTKQVIDNRMNQIKSEIQGEFLPLIEQVYKKRSMKNTIFILEPKISDFVKNQGEEKELKAHQRYNDIIYGLTTHYTGLQNQGFNVSQCVDSSLRAYLVCLYLKNETTKITLAVNFGDPTPIATQMYLERLDKLCKQKRVLQINNMVDYEFKIVQMYYLYDLKKVLNYFSNGLLIYHKNRLITRYKYKLGELIPRKFYKKQNHHNFLRLLGFIELPDHVPVNALKTNALHPALLQKLTSKIKLIEKIFKKQMLSLEGQGPPKRIAPTKQSNQEIEQEMEDQKEPKAKRSIEEKCMSGQGSKMQERSRTPRRRHHAANIVDLQQIQFAEPHFESEDKDAKEQRLSPCLQQKNEQEMRAEIPEEPAEQPQPQEANAMPEAQHAQLKAQRSQPKVQRMLEEEEEENFQLKIFLPNHPLDANISDPQKKLKDHEEDHSESQFKAEKSELMQNLGSNHAQMAHSGETPARVSFPIKIIKTSLSRKPRQEVAEEQPNKEFIVPERPKFPIEASLFANSEPSRGQMHSERQHSSPIAKVVNE